MVILSDVNYFKDSQAFVRGGSPEVFLRKGVLKICRKFADATLLKSHFDMGVLL